MRVEIWYALGEVICMAKSYGQKLKLLYLKDFLTEQSDERHPLSADRLMELLAEKGIAVERKTIYDDISQLQEYGMDIRL